MPPYLYIQVARATYYVTLHYMNKRNFRSQTNKIIAFKLFIAIRQMQHCHYPFVSCRTVDYRHVMYEWIV